MSALAEMERELIVERTRAGLAAAREQGRIGGRRRIMTTKLWTCRRMLEKGATRQQVADVMGVRRLYINISHQKVAYLRSHERISPTPDIAA
jgi:DNA invertase Pin-like site-specific DNA recombinase